MPITEQLSTGRRGWRRWGFAATSVILHAGLLAALVLVTRDEAPAATDEGPKEEVTFVDIRRFAPPPPPSSPTAPEQTAPEPETPRPESRTPQPEPRPAQPEPPATPRPTDLIDPVDSLPDEPLGAEPSAEPVVEAPPMPVPSTGTETGARSGEQAGGMEGGVEGGKTGGVVGGQGEEVPAPGETFVAAVVDHQADLTNRRDLPRLLRRLYPKLLRDTGVGGRVVVQFVVGVNGRVDMSTVKVISASNKEFVQPTREALSEFRFSPARIGDHKVRMLTQMPIVWEVES